MNTQKFTLRFLLILAAVLFTGPVAAQSFHCLEFASPTEGIVAGDNGTIIRTTDAGDSWQEAITNTTENINKTTAADGGTIVAVGNNGLILRSIDAGESWAPVTSNTTADLLGVYISASGNGFAVGESGTILRTVDHGASWSVIQENRGNNLHAISMADEDNGIIAGDKNSIFLTNDGGITWGPPTSGFAFELSFRYVKMINRSTAFITTSTGEILKSQDAGNSWQVVYNDPSHNMYFRVVNVVSDRIVCVGAEGNILISDDLGISWFSGVSGTSNDLYCLYFISDRIGFSGGELNTLLRTDDGGSTWTPVGYSLFNLDPADRNFGFGKGHTQVNTAKEFVLKQNYPNPFNPSTIITYTLGSASYVNIRVFDASGREAALLVNSMQQEGNHSITFNASGLSTGIYFYKMTVNTGTSEFSRVMKMILIK